MSGLWCASGQRSPTSSFDVTSPYDIPHLGRPPSAPAGGPSHPPPSAVFNGSTSSTTASEDSGVHCGDRSPENDEFAVNRPSTPHHPRNLPPSGPARPSSASAVKLSQRGNPSRDEPGDSTTRRGSNPISTTTTTVPKSTMFRSLSSFSLKTFSIRRLKDAASKRQPGVAVAENEAIPSGARMEQSRKRGGGSLPGEDRLDLSSETTAGADDEVQRKRTHTQVVAQRLSRIGRSFRRRQSADRAASEPKNPDPAASESSSTASSTSTSSSTSAAVNQAVILYGTASRGRRSSFKISISVPTFDSNGNASSGAERSGAVRKSGCEFATTPSPPLLQDGVRLVKILKLEQYVTNKWISGMAISDKNELVIVDLRSAYLVDEWGNLIRTIGSKGSDRLIEPIGVSAGPDGRLVFSDHAQQNVKVYTNRGNHLRTVTDFCLANIAGVACNRSTGEIFVAGTDRKKLFLHADGQTRTIPSDAKSTSDGVVFKHPFSVAYNPVSGHIIVGDDYDQSVMAVTGEGRLAWRFCPPTNDGERQFFPSSVCVDHDGTIFVADLYNGKVCVLDANGRFVRTLLSRDFGLSGNPGAIATDGRGHIFVADEERTVKVFQYKKTL